MFVESPQSTFVLFGTDFFQNGATSKLRLFSKIYFIVVQTLFSLEYKKFQKILEKGYNNQVERFGCHWYQFNDK